MRRMFSPSRFNRRLHRVKDLFLTLFAFIGEHGKEVNSESVYIIDSFPIASCDNIRIKRSRRYQGEDYRGYSARKRRYFYGVRLQLVVTARGDPVEFFLPPGAESDTGALQWYQFDLPAGSQILGDKAFKVYAIEDDLASIGLELCPLRKKNSTRTIPPWETYLRALHRKYIETAGSLIVSSQ
jgi:Transposase DDE domain